MDDVDRILQCSWQILDTGKVSKYIMIKMNNLFNVWFPDPFGGLFQQCSRTKKKVVKTEAKHEHFPRNHVS